MKLIVSVLKYLAIGICLGIGILIVDQLYFKYGNPQQVVIMEELLDELYEIHGDLLGPVSPNLFPVFTFRVLDREVRFEEACVVALRERPGFWCQDEPHWTRGEWSGVEVLEKRVPNIKRIAADDTFLDEARGELRMLTWSTDPERLRIAMEEMRTDPRPELPGVRLELPDPPPRFSALICDDAMCLTLSSGSRTKVKGLIAQILQGREG